MVIGSFCCLFVCSFIVSCWICVGSSLLLLALPRLSTLAIWGLQSFSDHGEARSLWLSANCGCSPNIPEISIFYRIFPGNCEQRSNGFENFSHGNFWRSKFRMKSKGSSIVGYSRHSRCRLWQFPVHQSSMISCAFGTHGYGCRIWSGFVSFAFHCFVDMNKSTVGNACNICQSIWSLSNQHPHSSKEPWQLLGCSAVVHTPSRERL